MACLESSRNALAAQGHGGFSLNAVAIVHDVYRNDMNQPTAKLTQAGTLATESPLRDLEAIIRSRTPLIAVESNEEPQVVGMVRQIGQRLQLKAYR